MKSIGDIGEAKARELLIKNKLKIIDTNWRTTGGEIDIIARRKHLIHFVEVKSRETSLTDAWLAINSRKQQRLVKAAQAWILEHGHNKWSYQFDAIAVSGEEIKWRENVFEAT